MLQTAPACAEPKAEKIRKNLDQKSRSCPRHILRPSACGKRQIQLRASFPARSSPRQVRNLQVFKPRIGPTLKKTRPKCFHAHAEALGQAGSSVCLRSLRAAPAPIPADFKRKSCIRTAPAGWASQRDREAAAWGMLGICKPCHGLYNIYNKDNKPSCRTTQLLLPSPTPQAWHLFYAIFSFESMRPSAKKSVNKEAPHPSVTKPCINHLPSLSI